MAGNGPNFGWDEARDTTTAAAKSAQGQVGFVLMARRLHLGQTQKQVAVNASKAFKSPGSISQPDISALESGDLPAHMKSGNDKIKAVLTALKWRRADLAYMVALIKEFARVQQETLAWAIRPRVRMDLELLMLL